MKIGVIGLGRRMSAMLSHFQQIAPDLKVVGLIDHNPENALSGIPNGAQDHVQIFDSLGELIKATSPDALAIGTRCDSHAAFAIEAAKYGLPIFLEKPVAINLAQATALEQAFLKSNSPVLVSFPLRGSTLCRHVKSIMEQGTIGRAEHLLAVNYVAYGDVYFKTWFRDYSVTQGLFLQKGTHDFDYLSWLMGSPIVRVAGMTSLGRVYQDSKMKSEHSMDEAHFFDEIGTPETGMNEDSSSALLEFANGVKGVYTQVFFSKRMPRRGATISGIKGTLEFDWYTNQIKVLRHHQASPCDDSVTVEGGDDHFGGDVELAECFIGMVKDKQPSIAPIGTGLASVYACLAAKESAETERFVDVIQTKLSC